MVLELPFLAVSSRSRKLVLRRFGSGLFSYEDRVERWKASFKRRLSEIIHSKVWSASSESGTTDIWRWDIENVHHVWKKLWQIRDHVIEHSRKLPRRVILRMSE